MLEMMTSSILKKVTEPGLEIDPSVFQKLMASDGTVSDQFGYSVAVSQTSVVIGAYGNLGKGAVYVF